MVHISDDYRKKTSSQAYQNGLVLLYYIDIEILVMKKIFPPAQNLKSLSCDTSPKTQTC